jgi:hypothetical protein
MDFVTAVWGVLLAVSITMLVLLVVGGLLAWLLLRRAAKKKGAGSSPTAAQYSLKIGVLHPAGKGAGNRLVPGGDGVWVWGKVVSSPADPQFPVEFLNQQVFFQVKGPNHDWIQLKAPEFKDGMQQVLVSAVPPAPEAVLQPGYPLLLARCSAEAERLEASLELILGEQLVFGAWVKGESKASVIFDPSSSQPGWVVPDLTAYFYFPGEPQKPIKPGFEFSLSELPVEVDPAVLEVVDVAESPSGERTIRLRVKSDTDLEGFFGEHLANRDGMIKAAVSARSVNGQVFRAEVTYQLQPRLELFAQHWDDPQRHLNKDLNLEGFEFLADGEDRISVAVACCRTDRIGSREIGKVEPIDPAWWQWAPTLQGRAMPGFEQLPPAAVAQGGFKLDVLSSKPLIYTPDHAARKLILHLEAVPTEKAPANYLRTPVKLDVELKPRYPDLHCWVVPGKQRGRSEAWMYLSLDRSARKPLKNKTLKIEITSPPSSRLKLANGGTAAVFQTMGDGSAQAELVYEGLNWDNLREARYSISCTLQSSSGMVGEGVKIEINVFENVRRLLQQLFQSSDMLKLNNPVFQNREVLNTNAIPVYRPALRGLTWNAAAFLVRRAKDVKEARNFGDFTGTAMCSRIARWLCSRRDYQPGRPDTIDVITSMNGIEYDDFHFGNLHSWVGIFLSSMEPLVDPRGLDPWWKQNWQDAIYLTPDGLVNKDWEKHYFQEMNSWIAALGTGPLTVLLSTFLTSIGQSLALTLDQINAMYTVFLGLYDLEASPTSRYDPASGYRFIESTDPGTPALKNCVYTGQVQFLKDWIDMQPQDKRG